ncbi:LysR family transcriptional regulator [Pseudaquabacterium pictum]|uniref:Isoleucine biosynthesis transcriptional activator n=1 Tax=Pseudaquabacterium pictum TaxID=2315236 RepID=A0A480ASS7_9BURK|nr:LysR family transcriptional regulator [Rubrivivax pictus]GCL63287.1 isoleucine biosynthesis transcriptional activator [Rubrivivax pictus]
MIELRLWRQFTALAEELHFGRAAARLHMTQPPLTQAIQGLERQLGVPLFVRTRRSVALTPAGLALLPAVRRLLAAAEALPQVAQAAAAGLAGQLRLAFVSSVAYGPLPEWLRSFREAHPDVVLQLREATLDVQLAAFDADEIDAGFLLHALGAVPPGFAAWPALTEPLVMALPASHPAAARPVLHLADVAAEPLVIFPRQIAPSLYDALLAAYRARGATPQIAQEAIQMQTIVNLVSAGMGLAWVPEAVTRLQRPGVVYRAVADAPLRCQTSLVWREQGPPVVQRFVAHVQGAPAGAATMARSAADPGT